MKLVKLHWKILVLASFILGLLTLYPWNISKPNFLGNYSFCNFAPVSTLGMFVIALALYFLGAKHRRMFYGTIGVLVVISSFVGYWYVNAKLPMENIQANIVIHRYWSGYSNLHEKNVTDVLFNLILYNPSDIDSLGFLLENPEVFVNNWHLPYYRVHLGNWRRILYGEYTWFGDMPINIKAHQNVTIQIAIEALIDEAPADVWASLQNQNFTLTIKAILTVRPYLSSSDSVGSMLSGSGKIVWVSSLLSVSSANARYP